MDRKDRNSKHLPARSRFGEGRRNPVGTTARTVAKFETTGIASSSPRNDMSVLSFRAKALNRIRFGAK